MEDRLFEDIMEQVCEVCHWTYIEDNQEALDARCKKCQSERNIRELLSGRT